MPKRAAADLRAVIGRRRPGVWWRSGLTGATHLSGEAVGPLASFAPPGTLPRVQLAYRIGLSALLTAGCGGPGGETAVTTTGITTVQPGSSDSMSSTGTAGSTGSTGASGASEDSSTTATLDTSTGSAPPDLPGFETLGPAQGCGKIDVLFVVGDGSYGSEEAGIKSAKAVQDSTNGFIAAMQEQAADYDLHVMVVKGDPAWPSTNGPKQCCTEEKLCDALGPYPCDVNQVDNTECDGTLGAGVRYPTGFMASNRDCELADGRHYITEAQEDFPTAFDCVINVGRSGAKQPYLGAMVKAVGPTLNAPDGCNAGFLRPDAMLVVVILAASWDETPTGTPEGFAASLIAAKDGYVDGIVVVGVLRSVDYQGVNQCAGDTPDDVARQMVEQFPNHVLGSYCAPDMGVHLSKALDVIDAACERFTPPG